MNRLLSWLVKPTSVASSIVLSVVLSACGTSDAPVEAPANVSVAAGDGAAHLSWTPRDGNGYWVFYAQGTTLEYSTRTSAPGYRSKYFTSVPATVTGLTNGVPYAFLVAAEKDGSPAGPVSASMTATPRSAGAEWSAAAALPVSALNAVAYSSSLKLFVAVGSSGAVYSSTDAKDWTARSSATGSDLYAITFSSGRFIAVGVDGTVIHSSNGIDWNAPAKPTSASLRAITDYNGTAIAVGDAGTVLLSGNGENWSAAQSGTTTRLNAIAASSVLGRLVIAGDSGTLIGSNTPSQGWQALASGFTGSFRGASAGRLSDGSAAIVIVGDAGQAIWSVDGVMFAATSSPGSVDLRASAFGTQFVAVGTNGTAFTSLDGSYWTAVNTGATINLQAITFGLDRFSAVGEAGVNLTSL
jgi:hypothetical protein